MTTALDDTRDHGYVARMEMHQISYFLAASGSLSFACAAEQSRVSLRALQHRIGHHAGAAAVAGRCDIRPRGTQSPLVGVAAR